MAALLDHVATGATDIDTITSGPIDTTGASLLVVAVAGYLISNPTLELPTDTEGNTWSPLSSTPDSSNMRFFYSHPTSTSASHTVTYAETASYVSLVFMAFDGYEAFDQQSVDNNLSPGPITPSTSGQLVITALQDEVEVTNRTIDSGFATDATLQVANQAAAHYGLGVGWQVQDTAAEIDCLWYAGGGTPIRGSVIASFKFTITAAGSKIITMNPLKPVIL